MLTEAAFISVVCVCMLLWVCANEPVSVFLVVELGFCRGLCVLDWYLQLLDGKRVQVWRFGLLDGVDLALPLNLGLDLSGRGRGERECEREISRFYMRDQCLVASVAIRSE